MATLFVPRETAAGERRVAVTPDTAGRFGKAGVSVVVESGAGEQAGFADDAYTEAGARIVDQAAEGWGSADLACVVQAPPVEHAGQLAAGAAVIGLMAPRHNLDLLQRLVERRAVAFAMELVPRTSRAQRMDALSSQANIAGYRAVTMAAFLTEKQFPLVMSAAGTIRPANVVVLGAGVAGLQAIATAKRLGAVVRANDIREAAKGEVESLGAEFIAIEAEADTQTEGGYAKEVDEDFLTRQRRILGDHLATAHAVITTAFVPGKPAPTLVTREMVERMQPGAVLIDLAAAEGGNCELTDGEGEVEHGGVRIIGAPGLAATMPGEASALYARNILEFTSLLLDDGQVRIDTTDDIIASALLVHDGHITHEPTAELMEQKAQT